MCTCDPLCMRTCSSAFHVTGTCLLVACISNATYQVVGNACGFMSD